MNFFERFIAFQCELKAPKNQYNSFGKYKYRSAEDILEALKPLEAKHGIMIIVSDEVVAVGNRVYVKATARAIDAQSETQQEIIGTAYARESDEKKGMDASQITGTASSYARKYALNGLFCIDDTKDADTDAYTQQISQKTAQTKPQSAVNSNICESTRTELNNAIKQAVSNSGKTMKDIMEAVQKEIGKTAKQFNEDDAADALEFIERTFS